MVDGSMRTRDRLVVAMAELMRRQGYGATSVKELVQAAGATMGSLYHHFPGGKAEVAAEALRSAGAAYMELLPALLDGEPDLAEALPAGFRAAAEHIVAADWITMCPVATVAGEVADAEPVVATAAAEVFEEWIVRGTDYFTERGLPREGARELTFAVIAALEGAFVLSRTMRTVEPLLAAGAALRERVVRLLATERR